MSTNFNMRIAIDVSQVVYTGTGVARYVRNLVHALAKASPDTEFILIGFAQRRKKLLEEFFLEVKKYPNVTTKRFNIPPKVLDILWNVFGIVRIEWFTGEIDIYWSSDWAQAPVSSDTKAVTTVHDLTIYKYEESFPTYLVAVHKRRLKRVSFICDTVFVDSESTKLDVQTILTKQKIVTVYPGYHI